MKVLRFIIINFVITFLVVDCIFGSTQLGVPSSRELLERCFEGREQEKSHITKSQIVVDFNYPKKNWAGTAYRELEIRSDGNRNKTIESSWGNMNPKNSIVKKDEAAYTSQLWDGGNGYSYMRESGYDDGHLTIVNPGDGDYKIGDMDFTKGATNGRISGIHWGDDEKIDQMISKSKDIHVRNEMETLHGNKCYVIEASIKGKGNYKIWIDPEHDYHIGRIEVKRSAGDSIWTNKLHEGDYSNEVSEVLEYEKIGEKWYPKKCKLTVEKQYYGIPTTEERATTYEMVTFNPDHDKLGSFLPDDIPNGTETRLRAFPPNMVLNWQDGELIPKVDKSAVDQIDSMMDEVLADRNNKGSIEALEQILTGYKKIQNSSSLYFHGVKTVKGESSKSTQCQYATDGSQIGFETKSKGQGINEFLWDGRKTLHYSKRSDSEKVTASDDKKKIYSLLSEHYPGAGLLGYFNGQNERIDRLLSKASRKASFIKADLNGVSCTLVKTQIGKHVYRVWFSPANDSNIVKAEIKDNSKVVYLLDQVKFTKIDSTWVPVSCTVMDSTGTYTYKRTKIDLTPDLVKLKAFVLPVSNGTSVSIEKKQGQFKWLNNHIVDKEGNNVY